MVAILVILGQKTSGDVLRAGVILAALIVTYAVWSWRR
jgi:hypothetical protein